MRNPAPWFFVAVLCLATLAPAQDAPRRPPVEVVDGGAIFSDAQIVATARRIATCEGERDFWRDAGPEPVSAWVPAAVGFTVGVVVGAAVVSQARALQPPGK